MSSNKRTWKIVLLLAVGLVIGCTQEGQLNSEGMKAASVSRDAADVAKGIVPNHSVPSKSVGGCDGAASAQAAQVAGREIIYTAQVRLAVDNFDSFPQRLAQAAVSAGGFVAESDVARMTGIKRSGRWVIRVPGPKYASFISAVSGLGVQESVEEKADDVTEKFIDLQARIKSGRQLEEQLAKLLERQSDRLENLLTVERELARVRMEIEQKEGALRFLQSQVALSTITVYASEQMAFVPEQAQTFSERISREWSASLVRTRTGFENVLIWFATNGLVLLCWLIGLNVAWKLFLRRAWNAIQSTPTANRSSGTSYRVQS